MPQFDLAHVREQGQDMIIFPLSEEFGRKSQSEQSQILHELEMRANNAGLRGKAVAVWPRGFVAPRPWHPFFRTFSYRQALANVNQTLSW